MDRKSTDKKYRQTNANVGLVVLICIISVMLIQPVMAAVIIPPGTIDPRIIPQFQTQITGPPPVWVATPGTGYDYVIDVAPGEQQILPPIAGIGCNPTTNVCTTPIWAYGGQMKNAITGASLEYQQAAPSASFEAVKGQPIRVKWVNNLPATNPHMFAVDPTLHWADPNDFGMASCDGSMGTLIDCTQLFPPGHDFAQKPVPIVTHLHGGEVNSSSDGHPEYWWTSNGIHGPATQDNVVDNYAIFEYPNAQPPTTLWYHDHALGITRLNVMSGLAGFYILRDTADTVAPMLPQGKYEIPLAIQDRTFKIPANEKAELYFDTVGLNPTIHPYWMPEFFGNTIMVNGKVWPNMNVEKTWYRFRLLDGSNARFYTISFWDRVNGVRYPFYQIGTDGGYLKQPVLLNQLTIAPGERADILVDFTNIPAGTKIILDNSAKYPFPGGAPPDKKTDGTIMQFTVTAGPVTDPTNATNVVIANLQNMNPTLAGQTFPTLTAPAVTPTRTLVLWEVMGALGPTEILLNGQKWMDQVSEMPKLGSTEDWAIVNPTADTHPIHLHLVQFQLVSRQKIDTKKYSAAWITANGGMMPPYMSPVAEVSIANYLQGKAQLAPFNERGWKDTIQMNPGEVTIIRARWAPIDGSGTYPFMATGDPGYVWHCHILDHEDNEMMRPYMVNPP